MRPRNRAYRGIAVSLRIKKKYVVFSLPVHWRKFQRVLELQQVRRWEEEYVYLVAWRNIRDWVMAQLALYETEIVDMSQVFLPFETDAKGQTLYDKMGFDHRVGHFRPPGIVGGSPKP